MCAANFEPLLRDRRRAQHASAQRSVLRTVREGEERVEDRVDRHEGQLKEQDARQVSCGRQRVVASLVQPEQPAAASHAMLSTPC